MSKLIIKTISWSLILIGYSEKIFYDKPIDGICTILLGLSAYIIGRE